MRGQNDGSQPDETRRQNGLGQSARCWLAIFELFFSSPMVDVKTRRIGGEGGVVRGLNVRGLKDLNLFSFRMLADQWPLLCICVYIFLKRGLIML